MTQKKKPKDEFKKKAPKQKKPHKPKEKPYTGGGYWPGNPNRPRPVPPHIRREQW